MTPTRMPTSTVVEFLVDYNDITQGTIARISVEKRNELIFSHIIKDSQDTPTVVYDDAALEPTSDNDRLTDRPTIEVPHSGRTVLMFAMEIAPLFSKDSLFYHSKLRTVCELTSTENKITKQRETILVPVTPNRLVNIIESKVRTVRTYEKDGEFTTKDVNLGINHAQLLLCCDAFTASLRRVDRILSVQMPILLDGELHLPQIGYDDKTHSIILDSSPKLTKMLLEEAVALIREIYGEFCFRDQSDKVMAIAHLITPMARGLFSRPTARTPLFFYAANRERSGKDTCASIVSIVYTGLRIEYPPLCSDDGHSDSSSFGKQILSFLLQGGRIYHSSNNRGYIRNASFESILTSERLHDRVLGRSEVISVDNEADYSLSANMGVNYTPDLTYRSRFVNLFLDMDDPNTREFSHPDFQGYILTNRTKILSAIYTLILEWYYSGRLQGRTFSSFPEWAQVVGGIMEHAGLGDPCQEQKIDIGVGGDQETRGMRHLFQLIRQTKGDGTWVVSEIIELLMLPENRDIFPYLDFENRGSKNKFGIAVVKFTGRVLGGLRLKLFCDNPRASRREYKIIEEVGTGGIVGISLEATLPKKGKINSIELIAKPTKYATCATILPEKAHTNNTYHICSACGDTACLNPDEWREGVPICADCAEKRGYI